MSNICKSEGCNNVRPYPKGSAYCNPCRNSIRRYGMSTTQREEALKQQGGKCKVCSNEIEFDGSKSQYSACIDHDHQTGKVRGILCGNCNSWIGYLENKGIPISLLESYLK